MKYKVFNAGAVIAGSVRVQEGAGKLFEYGVLHVSYMHGEKCDILKNLRKSIVFSCFSGNNAHPNVPEKHPSLWKRC